MTGSSATMPGNGWPSLMAKAEMTSRTAPAAPTSRAASDGGHRYPRQGERQQGAGGELPGAREGGVEGEGLGSAEVGGEPRGPRRAERPCDSQHERPQRDRADDDDRRLPTAAPQEQPGEDQQGREHEVELLLDRERPRVQERVGRGVVGEVVAGRVPDDVVGRQEHGAHARARGGLLCAEGVLQEDRRERHDRDDERERRGEPQEPSEVEVPEAHASVRAHSRMSMAVMTNPEMTKNTSTPTKPPGTGSSAWKTTTSRTAMARSPWMSRRRPGELLAGGVGGPGRTCVVAVIGVPRSPPGRRRRPPR